MEYASLDFQWTPEIIVNKLGGSPDDKDLESVCLSSLVPSCADPELISYFFITDYCSFVQIVCNGQSLFSALNIGASASRHASGIPSGSSRSTLSGSEAGSGGSGSDSDINSAGADMRRDVEQEE